MPFRARGYLEGRDVDVLRLGHDEAESSGAEGNQGGDGTSLATQAHGSVVVVVVVSAGGSLVHSAADTGSNAASLGGDPGLSGVDGGADVGSLILGPRLGLGSVLLTPALDVGSLVLSPGLGFGGVTLGPGLGVVGLVLGPGLDVVANVAADLGGLGDGRGSVVGGDEAGSGENGDLSEEHVDGVVWLVVECWCRRWSRVGLLRCKVKVENLGYLTVVLQ